MNSFCILLKHNYLYLVLGLTFLMKKTKLLYVTGPGLGRIVIFGLIY